MKNRNVLVVIPTFNCESQITRVLKKMINLELNNIDEINIIDNLSQDDTVGVSINFLKQYPALKIKIYQTLQNNNLGGTHKLAFDKAIKEKYNYVAIFHGDDQADFSDLTKIIPTLAQGKTEKNYLGSRFSKNSRLIGYSKIRIFGNLFLNLIYSIKCKKVLTDLGSGLNIYNTNTLRDIDYHNFRDDLTFNYDLLLSIVRHKREVEYFPITWSETDQDSNVNNLFFHGFKAIKILFQHHKGGKNSSSVPKVYKLITVYDYKS